MFFNSYFLNNFKATRLLYYSFCKQPQSFLSSAVVMLPYLISLQNMTQLYLCTRSEKSLRLFQGITLRYLHFLFFKQKIYYIFKLFKYLYYPYRGIVYYRYLFYYLLKLIQPLSSATMTFSSVSRLHFFNNIVIFKKKYRRPIDLFVLNKPVLLQSATFTFHCMPNLKVFFFFFYALKFRCLFSTHVTEKFVKSIFFCNFNFFYLLFFFPQHFQVSEDTAFKDCGLSFYVKA